MGHIDYKINNNFIVGGTIIHLTEKPFTTKVNIGYEPISNTIWGANVSYQTQSTLITKIIDKLPFVSTKDPSNITIDAEFANLIPGHNRAIGKEGNSFIDNFEGSMSSITLKNPFSWQLASYLKDNQHLSLRQLMILLLLRDLIELYYPGIL